MSLVHLNHTKYLLVEDAEKEPLPTEDNILQMNTCKRWWLEDLANSKGVAFVKVTSVNCIVELL